LWPSPGMYAVTSMPLLSFTRATLRRAEFGFFGVVVYTRVHTPRRWGLDFSAGALVFVTFGLRPLRTNCWIVGTASPCFCSALKRPRARTLSSRHHGDVASPAFHRRPARTSNSHGTPLMRQRVRIVNHPGRRKCPCHPPPSRSTAGPPGRVDAVRRPAVSPSPCRTGATPPARRSSARSPARRCSPPAAAARTPSGRAAPGSRSPAAPAPRRGCA
jgi:hypothetical protein